MKVKELIEELEKQDPEATVLCYSTDEELHIEERECLLAETYGISETEADRYRNGKGVAMLKYRHGAEKFVLVHVRWDW